MKLTFSEGSKICDEQDQQLHFEIEIETFELWSQSLRLTLILLKSSSNIETDTETFGRWSQSLRLALRLPWSQSQSRDQSLTHLCLFVTPPLSPMDQTNCHLLISDCTKCSLENWIDV